ncbi:MAG: DUF11 domain-containing protein [Microcoleus sp. SIO2G3]|nr:DUF11 domain-containing protein [Microcoleus sp. SIO2G3]
MTTFCTARSSPVAAQTTLVEETFSDIETFGWSVGVANPETSPPCLTAGNEFTPPGSIRACNLTNSDVPALGVLRITTNNTGQSAFLFYDYALPSSQGIVITFDYFSYGGQPAGNPPSEGDGLAFFLFNAEETDPLPGAFGGSLGYAQRTDVANGNDGVTQGYVGVGLNEYGNFANDGEGRGTGCTTQSPFGTTVNNRVLDSVTVRGSGNGIQGYCFLGNSGNLFNQFGKGIDFSEGIDEPIADDGNRDPAQRSLRIILSADNRISVDIDFTGTGNNYQQVIAPTSLATPDQAPLPALLQLGITSSTGAASNFHEIRNFRAVTLVDAPTPDLTLRKRQGFASFTPGGTGRYRLTVRNVGDGPTYSPTTVTDTLPPGFSLASFTGDGWNCSENPPGTVTCVYSPEVDDPAIQPGESRSVILTVNVPPTLGSYINTATVSTTADENPNNNTAQTSNLLPPPPPICNRAGDICQF